MKLFENINITINTDKAMNIFSGSINIAAGFIASIGINEIYKRIDKTGVSKARRYLMDCGIRAITIAATTPYITDGVKQLIAANSDKEKLVTVKMEEKTVAEVPGTPDDTAYEINDEDMKAQKNKIIEMLRGLVVAHGDIKWKLTDLFEYRINTDEYTISSLDTAIAEDWKEFMIELSDYNNNMHKAIGESYKFDTMKDQLIKAADDFASELVYNTDNAED